MGGTRLQCSLEIGTASQEHEAAFYKGSERNSLIG
jgi:hypothetical protein